MYTIDFKTVLALFCLISFVVGHVRIRRPIPLAAAVENPGGNYYNNPLRSDGSDFPCKGLHKRADVSKTPTETLQAGQQARFE
jgi:DNA-directed RNA polymerase